MDGRMPVGIEKRLWEVSISRDAWEEQRHRQSHETRYDATRWTFLGVALGILLLGISPAAGEIRDLTISDATFTDGVADRTPLARLTSFRMGDKGVRARLWFWFQVDCIEECLEHLSEKQRIPIRLHWYYDTGGGLSQKLVVPLTIDGPRWRTWGHKEGLKPGTWKVIIHTEAGRLCLVTGPCEFDVEVAP